MNGSMRRAATVAVVTLAVGGLSTPAAIASTSEGNRPGGSSAPLSPAEAVPGIAPPGAAKTAVYRDGSGRRISVPTSPSAASTSGKSGDSGKSARIGCTPDSGRDNPHRSATGVVVSGHGWWDKGNCSNNRAEVYNCLYEWYTDNSWRQKACSSKKVLKPGGGSSNRTVARHDCQGTQPTSWRNHVDVDVIDEIDTGENPMRQADANCRVY